jgi:hypothetical protein
MELNKLLNLVIPIDRDDDTKVYIHSIPILYETFQRYFLVLSKTYTAFFQEGLSVVGGPRIAAMLLRTIAEKTPRSAGQSWWEGDDGVEKGLMAEVRRLSNFISLEPEGWTPIPLQLALDRKLLSAEEVGEVENQLVFFMVASRVPPKADREALVTGGASMSNSLITSLNSTEYAQSLRTSTMDENTGEKAQRRSSVRLSVG